MAAPHYTPSGNPVQGSGGASKEFRDEFELIEAAFEVMNNYPLFTYFENINSSTSRYMVIPWSCTIEGLYVTPQVANATTLTTLGIEIGGVAVVWDSSGAPIITSSQTPGQVSSGVPASANQVTVGSSVEITTDNGGSSTMPAHITLLLKRV